MTENQDDIGKGVTCKPYIVIPSDEKSFAYDKDHFLIPSHYRDDIKNVMIPKGVILDRIEKIAMDIYETYGDEELHIICVLKGSRGFFSALVEVLNRIRRYTAGHKTPPYIEHYVRLKSYSGMESTGKVQVMADDLATLQGKHVLVVEDIIDTGRSLSFFCRHLLQFKPRTVRLASLLLKNLPKESVCLNLKPDFCGFLIPPEFIVGFFLDYNEMFRDLEHIAVLDPKAIEKYKNSGATH
jgi:hypoxanthine phosphoribosyltransferase